MPSAGKMSQSSCGVATTASWTNRFSRPHPPTAFSRCSKCRLRVAFLEAPDVRLGIVKDVAQKVGQVARQRIHIRAVPAASRHGEGESADELKAFKLSRRLR